jgi:hypothetical protein
VSINLSSVLRFYESRSGILSALIDIAGDYAVSTRTGGDVPTVDLPVDYLRPARGSLIAVGRAIKVGRTVGIADVEVRDEEGRAHRHRPRHLSRTPPLTRRRPGAPQRAHSKRIMASALTARV